MQHVLYVRQGQAVFIIIIIITIVVFRTMGSVSQELNTESNANRHSVEILVTPNIAFIVFLFLRTLLTTMKEYYKDTSARVYYDSEVDTLFLEYLGKVLNDDHFIKINTAVLDSFKRLKTQKFVADIRKMGIIGVNSQKWVIEVLLPGMIEHLKGKTLFHAQLLDPKEIMAKVSGGNIKSRSSQKLDKLEMRQFTETMEMTAFLKNWKG